MCSLEIYSETCSSGDYHLQHLTNSQCSFPEVFTQGWRYVSDRTGIISFANFPLIWLFGMRNNLLMWLTGWDFGTYNNFHRWVARVATVQAIVHSVGYTVLVFDSMYSALMGSVAILTMR